MRLLIAFALLMTLSACDALNMFEATGDGGEIRPGRAVRAALEADDPKLDTGEFVDVWTFSGRQGERYVIEMTSGEFDPYLVAAGPGVTQANDDSGQDTRNSMLDFTLAQDGQVTISATSYSAGETGRYRIKVERVPTAETAAPGRIAVGGADTGRLEAGGAQREGGQYANSYVLNGRAGEVVEIALTSGDFDPYVEISGPEGFSDFNDDDPNNGLNSRLVTTLPADGEYRITATTYASGQTGAYRLSVARADAAAAAAYSTGAEASSGARLAVGEEIRGSLQTGDGQLQSGEFVDTYRFIGSRGQRIRIAATSGDFDTYLILRPPSADQIDNDDGPDGRDARLDEVLPEDGEYEIQVTSYQPGENGVYRLALGQGQESVRQQGVEAGQRVFAVMVGVSDYGGTVGNLPYTDDDATNLEAELRRQGVLNPASVVLINAQATRASMTAALNRVAAEAGPEDLFLFFFSGHGVQRASTSDRELDGQSENIVLRDGEISDVQLAQMFGRIRARLSVVVLDSCFSGGFAREVINRPGVMGVFSSEEDLTSMVADRFQAGGYLSHFLREGLGGRADQNGDRLITAGELSTYLRRQFNTEVTDVEAETSDGQRNYQNLVIDRGGVQVDDVIIRLAGAR